MTVIEATLDNTDYLCGNKPIALFSNIFFSITIWVSRWFHWCCWPVWPGKYPMAKAHGEIEKLMPLIMMICDSSSLWNNIPFPFGLIITQIMGIQVVCRKVVCRNSHRYQIWLPWQPKFTILINILFILTQQMPISGQKSQPNFSNVYFICLIPMVWVCITLDMVAMATESTICWSSKDWIQDVCHLRKMGLHVHIHILRYVVVKLRSNVRYVAVPISRPCHSGRHYWYYYPGALSLSPVNSLQLIWRSGSHRVNLLLPGFQMNCKDLTAWKGTRIVTPNSDCQATSPIEYTHAIYWGKNRENDSKWST